MKIAHIDHRGFGHFRIGFPENNVLFGEPNCIFDLDAAFGVNNGVVSNGDTVSSWVSKLGHFRVNAAVGTVIWNESDASFGGYPSIANTGTTDTLLGQYGAVPVNGTLVIVFQSQRTAGVNNVFLNDQNINPTLSGSATLRVHGSLTGVTGQGHYSVNTPQVVSTGSKDNNPHILLLTPTMAIRDTESAGFGQATLLASYNSFGYSANSNGFQSRISRILAWPYKFDEVRARKLIASINEVYKVF
jgi:hypothetical protein